jgi:UPF0755 protein
VAPSPSGRAWPSRARAADLDADPDHGTKAPSAAAGPLKAPAKIPSKPLPGNGARSAPGGSAAVQPPSRRDRVDATMARHRSASSLPLDPPVFEAATNAAARMRPASPGRGAPAARWPIRPGSALPYSASAVPVMPGAVESNPSASGRQIERIGAPLMDQKPDQKLDQKLEQKRITPRSPRAALEPEHVSVPTRRSGRVRNPFVMAGNAVFTLLILLMLGSAAAFVVGKSRFEAPGPLEEDKVVNIPPRLGLIEIADLLRQQGVMNESNAIFIGSVIALKARTELKFGEYLFTKHASVRDVLGTMVEGKVVQHPITVAEGLTSEQIVQVLLDSDVLSGNIDTIPREGSLLPGTYNESRGVSREQVIQRMQAAQQRLIKDTWEHRSPDLPLKTPEQLVILASIIEKETGKPEERTRVAAVFVNRLKQKMKLQSDPTIIYGLVFGKGRLDHPITKSEKEQPTAYNTYFIDGLPPGPITNPGRASLEAAANPARTKELYFVADGTGGHSFSDSYDQHQKNVGKLRTLEQEAKDSSDEALAPARAAVPGKPGTPAPKRAPKPQ